MFDKIVFMNEGHIFVKLKEGVEIRNNLLNLHVVISDTEKHLLGEIEEIKGNEVKIRLLGEFREGTLYPGVLRKPLLDAQIRGVVNEEIPLILGKDDAESIHIGGSPFYNNFPIYFNINDFFSNHFAIFGNSGSGKSWGLAKLLQNVFHNQKAKPYRANFILFDISGEYSNAFNNLNTIDPNYNYRVFTSSEYESNYEKLRIPIWFLDKDDLALLLQCDRHSQLPLIERMIKLAKVFAESGEHSDRYKDHLIAKAIISVLYSDQTPAQKRNDIYTIVEDCATENFHLDAVLQGVGYTRKLSECFNIDKTGTFTEGILLTEYVTSFIDPALDNYEPQAEVFYNLAGLRTALNFALISEGWYKNSMTYSDAVTVKVKLDSLISGSHSQIFDYPNYVNVEQFLSNSLIQNDRKYQIININLEDMDDTTAAVITKIFTKIIFNYSKKITNRGSIPFHIIVDEAHRYIRNDDNDLFLIGYNIFERVAKEGRKYGILLGIITQRPVELSDTVISQCSNFMIFKTNHPKDAQYIKEMVPNISDEIVEKQKSLQSGTCLGFGTAFKIPVVIRLDKPDPAPLSSNSDVMRHWGSGQ